MVYWPETTEALIACWHYARTENIPVRIIGLGSNILCPDEGLPGLTVVTTRLTKIFWEGRKVVVGAGYSLGRLALEAGQKGLSGLEFARGIPGTVGGAIVMNAGAHGEEIADRLVRVETLDENGQVRSWERGELQFGYRQSSLSQGYWVLQAMKENLQRRKRTQPLEFPNAGSVFRNPPGDSAGRLIEQAGWKGKRVGGAEVSEKHANFIINRGNATAQDVLTLIEAIQADVLNKFGVRLEPEIKYLTARR